LFTTVFAGGRTKFMGVVSESSPKVSVVSGKQLLIEHWRLARLERTHQIFLLE